MGIRYGGRTKGTPNKATQAAREVISVFVDGNAHRLQEWLEKVADGVPKTDAEGNPTGDYWVRPDPEKAFSLFQSVIEFSVPKLARTELTGKNGEGITLNVTAREMKL